MAERSHGGLDDVIETKQERKPKITTKTPVLCPLCSCRLLISDAVDIEVGVGQALERCSSGVDPICKAAHAREDNREVAVRYQRLSHTEGRPNDRNTRRR